LDSVLSTTAGINAATFTTGHSGNVNVSESLTLSYDLTLDGVTQLVSQPATWTVTVPGDSFVALAASSPVLFVTPVGSWEVTLNAYSFAFPGPDLGVPASLLTTATFAPVPEPSSLALIVAGVMVFLGLAVKKAIA
jgi:hypothetical protein